MNEILTGIDEADSIRSDVNQVTEEAVKRVQSQGKQAKKIAQQIKKDRQINNQLAQFLSFLINTIDDEAIIKAIVETFFKTTNPKNKVTYLRKDINTYVVVGFFVPFFLKEAEQKKIDGRYQHLGIEEAGSSLDAYIAYLKKLSETYHDNVPVDEDELLNLILLITKKWLFRELGATSEDGIKKKILSDFEIVE